MQTTDCAQHLVSVMSHDREKRQKAQIVDAVGQTGLGRDRVVRLVSRILRIVFPGADHLGRREHGDENEQRTRSPEKDRYKNGNSD